MARFYLTTAMLVLAAAVTLAPARAQFGSIFAPPRPPGEIPNAAPPPPPNFPTSRDRTRDADRQMTPNQPLPAPQRGFGSIQSQPLAPPPGGTAAPSVAPSRSPPMQQAAPPQAPRQAPQDASAPRQPAGAPQQPVATAPPITDEVALPPPEHRLENPTAVFSGLDKITGRTISFDVAINETVQFGALQVTPRACYSRPPTETPRTDAFVAVDEVTLQGEVRRIFTGWMFAASPGLHAVEHPIYDVWLTDCKGAAQPEVAEAPADAKPAPKPKASPPSRRRSSAQPPALR
jgi:hypothetical protein